MLLPAMKNAVFQKWSSNEYALITSGPGGLKVVLALLIKVVIFHMRVSIIEIRVHGL